MVKRAYFTDMIRSLTRGADLRLESRGIAGWSRHTVIAAVPILSRRLVTTNSYLRVLASTSIRAVSINPPFFNRAVSASISPPRRSPLNEEYIIGGAFDCGRILGIIGWI